MDLPLIKHMHFISCQLNMLQKYPRKARFPQRINISNINFKKHAYRFENLYNPCQLKSTFKIFFCSFGWKFENHFVIVPTFNSQDHSKWQQFFKRHKMHLLLYGNEWRAFGVCGLVSIDAILHRRIIDIYFVVFCFIYTSRR